MLFPDNELFEYVLTDLGEAIAARPAPPKVPLPCDRYVARSCLQKAIRRGDATLAQRALANLYEHDRRSTWRALAIIALEDVGVANVEVAAWIVAAHRSRRWREQAGGDWHVMAELVRQMAVSDHCQAACDLLLRAVNDPKLGQSRAVAMESSLDDLASSLWNGNAELTQKGLAALAMGGGLLDGQAHHDPCAAFDILAESSGSSLVVAICRAAWKLTRNPMALLLPLVWERWMLIEHSGTADDVMPPVQLINGVPGYALDQFTRIGNTILRQMLTEIPALNMLLGETGVSASARPRAVGDILFLAEGGLVRARAIWPEGDAVRLPYRELPSIPTISSILPQAVSILGSHVDQLAALRSSRFRPGR